MKTLQFSIIKLKDETLDTPFYFDELVDISDLAMSDSNDIRSIDQVRVNGFVVSEKDEFIFSFTLTGKMILPCARTLVDVSYPFEMKSDEVFSLLSYDEGENEEVHHVTGEMIDLTPYIKENIILKMPYRVFSDEKGLQKGTGWDFYDEEAFEQKEAETIDPRLAKLQQLIDPEKEE